MVLIHQHIDLIDERTDGIHVNGFISLEGATSKVGSTYLHDSEAITDVMDPLGVSVSLCVDLHHLPSTSS